MNSQQLRQRIDAIVSEYERKLCPAPIDIWGTGKLEQPTTQVLLGLRERIAALCREYGDVQCAKQSRSVCSP